MATKKSKIKEDKGSLVEVVSDLRVVIKQLQDQLKKQAAENAALRKKLEGKADPDASEDGGENMTDEEIENAVKKKKEADEGGPMPDHKPVEEKVLGAGQKLDEDEYGMNELQTAELADAIERGVGNLKTWTTLKDLASYVKERSARGQKVIFGTEIKKVIKYLNALNA